MITGVTPENLVNRIFEDTLKKPSELGVEITECQEAALMKGLAIKDSDRISSMRDLEKAFDGLLDLGPDVSEHGKEGAEHGLLSSYILCVFWTRPAIWLSFLSPARCYERMEKAGD